MHKNLKKLDCDTRNIKAIIYVLWEDLLVFFERINQHLCCISFLKFFSCSLVMIRAIIFPLQPKSHLKFLIRCLLYFYFLCFNVFFFYHFNFILIILHILFLFFAFIINFLMSLFFPTLFKNFCSISMGFIFLHFILEHLWE